MNSSAKKPERPSLFGTDGIRGPAGVGPLAPQALVRLGLALAMECGADHSPKRALIGRDPRVSGPSVATALSAGLLAGGVAVTDGGVLPTPAVAMLTKDGGFDMGLVVSASHNQWQDNGVKLLGPGGGKVDDRREARISKLVAARTSPSPDPSRAAGLTQMPDGVARYTAAVRSEFAKLRLTGVRVAVDAANGAQSGIASELLLSLGAQVLPLSDEPNGKNINDRCGALHPGGLARAVRRASADLGIAFDGDADRVQLVDEGGRLIDGDGLLATLAPRLLAAGRLPGACVVGTSMTNGALDAFLRERGISLLRTDVGDRHILAAMKAHAYGLGGEPSGHVILPRDGLLTGDGLRAALSYLAVMRKRGAKASEVTDGYRAWPLAIESFVVRAKTPIAELPNTRAAIVAAERSLGLLGRVVVRYSGTEPKLRIMVEARTKRALSQSMAAIVGAARREVGAS